MDLLKQKLAQQEIVNDALIRQSVKKNTSYVNRNYRLLFILDIIFIPLFYLIFCNYMTGCRRRRPAGFGARG